MSSHVDTDTLLSWHLMFYLTRREGPGNDKDREREARFSFENILLKSMYFVHRCPEDYCIVGGGEEPV